MGKQKNRAYTVSLITKCSNGKVEREKSKEERQRFHF